MQQMQPLKNKHRGSYTVEAAVIIPFSLFLIALLIAVSFALYNRCSLERAVCVSVLRGSQMTFSSNEERRQEINRAMEEVLRFNTLDIGEVSKSVMVSNGQISASVETTFKDSVFATYSKKKIMNPVGFIRGCRKLKEIK